MLEESHRNIFRALHLTCHVRALFLLPLILIGCQRSAQLRPAVGEPLAAACPAATTPLYYLRLEKGGPLQQSAAEHLRLADVPPLWCGSPATTFRLLYLPSHRSPVVVSFTESPPDWFGRTQWTAKVVRFEDSRSAAFVDSGGGPRVAERTETRITPAQANAFVAALNASSFWNATGWSERGVDDGTVIVIEGQQDGVYRLVGRWSADASMFDLASVFARTAHLPVASALEDMAYRLQKEEGQSTRP